MLLMFSYFPGGSDGKESACNAGDPCLIPGLGISPGRGAPHSSTLAWKIPWTEEPQRLQSMGSRRVGHWLSDFTFTFHFHALEKEMASHSSVLAWRIPGTAEPGGLPSVCGVAQSRTWLKRLSSSSSSSVTNTFLYLGPVFLQWPHLSSFSLVPYDWLYLFPSLFFLSHFLQKILIIEWNFCRRSSKWVFWGFMKCSSSL